MAVNQFIRQPAFSNPGRKMLKGGLHCHTTRSDGEGSPEEVERLHIENGYDFLAITDHSRYNRVNYLPDGDLLIIPGMEMNCDWDIGRGRRHYHAVCLGPDDETNGFAHDEWDPHEELEDPTQFQSHLDKARHNNNIAFYCHPHWSATPVRCFESFEGLFAMEVWNSGCALELDRDIDNGIYWDELLGLGKRIIWGVATDDGHAIQHHCKGWVRVNAEKNIPAILHALQSGAFYASCGPEIYDFYVQDGVAHIHCSPCRYITFYCDRHNYYKKEPEGGITEATEGVSNCAYIRACVVDEEGRRAWTNPIFLDGRDQ